MMNFLLLDRNERLPSNARNLVCLTYDNWNDYSYITMFFMNYIDEYGSVHPIGNIKIGFKGQTPETSTCKKIIEICHGKTFESLPENFFSLAEDVEFYKSIMKLPKESREYILGNLNDVVYKPELFDRFKDEDVFKTSLMRSIRDGTIKEQFRRVLDDKPPLTNFKFSFIRTEKENMGNIQLDFNVIANSTPSTNIHAIIGRNGVGKTTLLNGMIKSFTHQIYEDGGFYTIDWSGQKYKINNDYFSYLVAVSFSIFDPFIPNHEDLKYYSYVGLKKSDTQLKSSKEYFEKDFLLTFQECKSFTAKKERWLNAIQNLESDDNFAEMQLSRLIEDRLTQDEILKIIGRISSGHASVLLIITQLVAKVQEKTLVLLDEPESHLHPPLLSAFVRALSDLLDNRNGVAIIATHSPVVLQEVPRSCVWKIERTGKVTNPYRPNIETFGENVGVLTREVFGLEVIKSGFHKLLTKEVSTGKSYEEILFNFNEQLGTEAKILLKTLVRIRDDRDGGNRQ
ncbi:TPA: AAA family ATPase [Neisseria subflava]|jgi:phage hau3 resistance protein